MNNLNNIPSSGTWGDAASRLNDNFNKIKQAVTTVENTSKNNKGYFTSLSALNTAFPSPKDGQTAYVYDEASSTKYYIYNAVNGEWVATSIEAPSVGVDLEGYTKTGGSTKTTKEVEDDLVQLAGDFDIYPFKQLNVIKRIPATIITTAGVLKTDSGYTNIFEVVVYSLTNKSNVFLSGKNEGNYKTWVLSSTLNKITAIQSGIDSTSTRSGIAHYLDVAANQTAYLFVTRHLNLNGIKAFDIDLVDGVKNLEYLSGRISPVETIAGKYLATNNSFITAFNYDVDIYDVSEISKLSLIGRFTANTLVYAFVAEKGTASGISAPIQTKTIVGNEYVNLDLDVPVNAKFMYVTRFKNETNLDTTNYKTYANAFVIAEYKDRVVSELPVLTEFKNYYLLKNADNTFSLMPIDAKFSVKLYEIKDFNSILLYGNLAGSVFDYVVTKDTKLNVLSDILLSGRSLSSAEGVVFYNKEITVPTDGRYIWITSNNYQPKTNFRVCKKLNASASDISNNTTTRAVIGNNIILIPIYGQSNALGGEEPIITTYENQRHRGLILNENLSALVGGTLEHSGFGLGEGFFDFYNDIQSVSKNDFQTQLAILTSGVGSTSIIDLKKGSVNYTNLVSAITNSYNKAKVLGFSLTIPAVCWIQGEQDRFNTYTTDYKGTLAQLAVDLNADIKAITGQVSDVYIITYQTNYLSSDAAFAETKFDMWSYVPNAQMELVRDNSLFLASSPTYPLDFVLSSNNHEIHLTALSQKILGYYEGLTIAKLLSGFKQKGFTPKTFTASGNSVNVTFNVPYPPVVIDKELVKEASNWGFAVINSANQNILQSIDIIENSNFKFELKLNCSTSPVGCKVRYAVNGDYMRSGYDNGCRGNLRDSQGNKYTAQILGKEYPLHNWLWQFDMLIN